MRELEDYFKALADVSRLRIMNLLLHGELCVCDIQRILEAPQPNVSRHLAYLRHSGLVLDRRDGLRMFYRLADSNEGVLGLLFDFLRGVFGREKLLQQDMRRLRQAIQGGHCTMSEWHPYGALERPPRQERRA
jgi:ArsR family transcriptional regulator